MVSRVYERASIVELGVGLPVLASSCHTFKYQVVLFRPMNEQGDLLAKIEVYSKSNNDLAIGNDSSSYLERLKFKVNINKSKYLEI